MPPPVDIVKVAIEWPGANAQLIEMDQVCVSQTNLWINHCEAFFLLNLTFDSILIFFVLYSWQIKN